MVALPHPPSFLSPSPNCSTRAHAVHSLHDARCSAFYRRSFYDKLLREWMGRHGREKACALDSDRDMVREACIPLVEPLTRFRDLCDAKREAWYTYI